jgi:proteasome accessory factor B
MNLTRVQRLLKLTGLLQAGRGYNADALAQTCGVSRRTIFRDLDALRESGIPLLYDEQQQSYRLPGATFLPPTNFTPQEAMALIVLCQDLGEDAQVPFFTAARQAAVKLQSSLPGRLREHLLAAAGNVKIRMPPRNPLHGQEPVYEQLLEASSRRCCVRIRYDSLTERELVCTKLSPYQLLFSRRSWYVIGRSSLHRSVRTFNVGRILDLEPLKDRFEVPRGFSLSRYLRNAWHLIPEPGPDHEVLIRFSPKVAQNVAEVQWHKTQQTNLNDDGTLDFSVTVSGLNEISWWILGYGAEAEVVRPERLRQIVFDHARAIVDRGR